MDGVLIIVANLVINIFALLVSKLFGKKRARDHIIALSKQENGRELFSVINQGEKTGWLYLFLKNFILADFFYFKNSSRNHFQLVKAFFITLNIVLYGLGLALILEAVGIGKSGVLTSLTPYKIIYAAALMILSIYWNLVRDINSKFDYCLKIYNQIYMYDNRHSEFLEVNLALDILTMDLWSKRILRPFFSRVLDSAYFDRYNKSYEPSSCCALITEDEAYSLLCSYAKKVKRSW